MKVLVRSFGESMDGKDKWYQLDNGERVDCDEETIQVLWEEWICIDKSPKVFTDTESVFVFNSSIELLNPDECDATKFK